MQTHYLGFPDRQLGFEHQSDYSSQYDCTVETHCVCVPLYITREA